VRDPCPDCGRPNPPPFMVWDDVWAEAGLKQDAGWLCPECFEKRLGRKLVLQDFTGARINFFKASVSRHLGIPETDPEFRAYFTKIWREENEHQER